jgi:hypothetical protein
MPSRPQEHHLPIPLFSLCRQNTSAIRDRLRGPCGALISFLRFLRILRNGLSVKTSDWGAGGWIRPKTPLREARVGVSSPPSAPLNGITELFDKPFPTLGRNPCVAGNPVSHHQSPSTMYARTSASCSCARSVIRSRRSQCGVPQLAFRAYPDDALEDRGGALP